MPENPSNASPSYVLGTKLLSRTLFLLVVLGVFVCAGAQQVVLPPGFVAEPYVTNVDGPVDMAFSQDGRLFIAEKSGGVRVALDGELLEEPFLDIRDEVNQLGDRGLTGLALHPRFPDVPYVYLSYTYDPPEVQALTGAAGPDGEGTRVSRIVRVTADPAADHLRALPDSEFVLVGGNSTFEHMGDPAIRYPDEPSCGFQAGYVQDCLPADEHSHTSGRVRFGPDGALYVGSGDGADYVSPRPYHVRTLSLDSLAGKLLRIDPITGEGLPDNPFFDGDPNSNRSKVLSYGLRNPYSFTFHPETWEPVMGEAGWATWEMVKVGAGLNFGWPCYEGGNAELLEQPTFAVEQPLCQDVYAGLEGDITPPAFAYNREGTGGAITVGDVYLGERLPAEYHGALFITDYYQGWIRIVQLNEEGEPGVMEDFAEVPFPVLITTGPDDQLYYLNVWGREIVRLRYTGGSEAAEGAATAGAPVVVADVSPLFGRAPLQVSVDASRSYDPAGSDLEFEVEFGAEYTSPFPDGSWIFFDGDHIVRITATNEAGVSSTAEYVVRVGADGPRAVIEAPAAGALYSTGDVIEYAGRGEDADGQPLEGEALRWQLRVHTADGVNPEGLPPAASGSEGAFYAADRGEEFLELCLTAVDAQGAFATTCTELQREE